MIVSMMPVQLFADNSVIVEGQSNGTGENGTGEASGNSNAVAKIGDTGYEFLAAAIAAANGNGTVTLLTATTELVQALLDGQYGSIDGLTIELPTGDYGKLKLGRATKYAGSNTEYFVGGFDSTAQNYKAFASADEIREYKGQSAWTPSCYYRRALNNVTIKAADGATVTIEKISADAGQIYGKPDAPKYDYVLDVEIPDTNKSYYMALAWNNVTFKGINFKSSVNIESSSEKTLIDGLHFEKCSFNSGYTALAAAKDANATSKGMGIRFVSWTTTTNNLRNLTVNNCTFEDCSEGVYTNPVYGVSVTNSSFNNINHNAVAIQDDDKYKPVDHGNVVISGNTFTNVSDRIIRFNNAGEDTTITITGNTSVNSGDSDGEIIKATTMPDSVNVNMTSNKWGDVNGKTAVLGNGFKPTSATIDASKYETLDDAIKAAKDGDVIVVSAGEYKLPGSQSLYTGKAFTIKAAVGVKVSFDMSAAVALHGAKITFDGVTFDYKTNGNYIGLQHADTLVYNNCIINGLVTLYATNETFNGCTFNAAKKADGKAEYSVWTYGAKNVKFDNCIFNCDGKAVNVYIEAGNASGEAKTIEVNDVAVNSTAANKAFLNIKNKTQAYEVTLSGDNKVNGLDANSTTGSNLYQVEATTITETDGKTVKVQEKASDGTLTTVYEVKAASTAVATVGGVEYATLAEAIAAAPRKATVKLLADTKENVTIDKALTLDLNGFTLNGGTEKAKPALTITARTVTIKDSSEAQTGTIMREDTAENSGVSSHYVIDIQGNAWVMFESGKVTNNSGNTEGKGASLVRVGNDSVAKYPGLNIKGGTFTQDNFIVIKVDSGDLFLNGGTLNSANSYAIENWHRATIKGGTVNGAVSSWTYSGGSNSTLEISGGTVNGDVESVSYDGSAGKKAKVSITGGTVNGTLSTKRYDSTTAPGKDMATIEITGGTFSSDPTKYVIEDFAITKNDDGTFGVGVAKAYLARIGETSYYTMEDAFEAQTDGDTIVLLRDYTTGSPFRSGSINRTVDLNGHTWTCTGTATNSAAFEINNPNVTLTVKNGKIVSSQLVGLIPSASGGVSGGTITYDNSSLVFEGVEMSTTATSGIETNGNNTNDTVTLKNSTLNVPNGFGIYFPSSGKLTLDNSTVNAKTMGVQVCAGSLSINEGSAVTVTGDAVPKAENDGAIQDGAAISIVNRTGYKGLDTVTISGGKFTAKEGNSAIKAYDWANKTESDFTADKGTVAVSGGTFSSAVPADLCAEGLVPVANTDGTYGVKAGKYVAQIGDVKYETLADALAAANAGDTVTLLADINTPEKTYEITKSLTIDLNGKTVTGSGYDGVFEVTGENIKVVLDATNGGKVIAVENSGSAGKYAMAVWMCGAGSTLTINGGEFIQNITSTNDKQMDMIYASAGTIIINSGSFTSGTPKWTLNINDSAYKNGTANIIVNGGTFTGYDPRNAENEGNGTSLVADGVGIDKNADGTFTAKSGMAAQIVDADGNSVAAYATLADAIAAANAGETVKLLADVTADVVIDKNITLDLGGKTLTNTGAGKATISVTGGTVTVKNGTVIGGTSYYNIEVTKGSNANLTLEDVTATAGNIGSSMIDNWGTMTIKSGTYTGGLNVVKSEEGSTLTINGGKFELNYAVSNSYTGVILSAGTTTISGGEFIQNATTPRWGYPQVVLAQQVDGYISKIEITGGTFTNKKSGSNIFHGYGKATSDNFEVSGGTFNKSVSESYCAEGFIPTKNADGTYGVKAGKYVAKVGSTGYETLDEAIAAANKSSNSKTIKLLEDLTVDHKIVIKNVKDKAITLDLGGKTLTSTLDANGYSLYTETKVTIKNGTYKGTGTARGIGAYADFVLDGVTVDVAGLVGVACSTGGKTYAIKNSVVKAGYAVCNFANNATITISDSTLTGTGNVLYHNGSNYGLKLTVTNSTITGTSDDCCGVYISGSTSAQANFDNQNGAGGYQQATFTKCTISGTNGIEVKYTDLTLDGCTVISTSDAAPSYTQNNNGPAASGFAVVSTDNATQGNTPKPEGTIIVKGEGKYTGPVGLGSLESVKTSYAGFNDETIKVSGGTFSSAVPEEYCAEGFIPTKNADGTYGVKEGMYVAKVGSTKYETLADAIAAANAGDTVTLLANVSDASDMWVTKDLTIDFGTYTVTGKAGAQVLKVSNAKVTLKGTTGGINGGAGGNNVAVLAYTGADITIEGGNYTVGGDANNSGNATIYIMDNGKVTINGGTFSSACAYEGKYYVLNVNNSATGSFTVNGGTFKNFDPLQGDDNLGGNFCGEGVGINKDENGNFTAVPNMAAQIVDENGNSVAAYATLAEAIAAAKSGATVTLLSNTRENVTISKELTLDLNGHTLSGGTTAGKAALTNYGKLTINDSSEAQTGTIKREDNNTGGYYVIDNKGKLTINGGNVINDSGKKGSSLIRNGGAEDDNAYPTLNIIGGTFTQLNFIAIKNDALSILNVSGGKITSNASAIQNWYKATITGGEINGQLWTDAFAWDGGKSTGNTTISGNAKFNGEIVMDITSKNVVPELNISGGDLNVTNWRITTEAANAGAKPAVSGGTFSSAVPEEYCADGFIPTKNADGTYGVKEGKYVAQIGDVKYETLEEAFAAAKNGDTITLLEDCKSDRINLEDKSVTVVLNGKTLTSTAAYGVMFCAKNGNKITIDGTVEGSKLVGTLMITSGTDGHIEVNGGTYESNQYCPIYVNGAVSSENSTVTVKNAIIKATNSSSDQDMGCGVYLAGYSTSVFENCTITAPITGIEIRAGKLTLNNCNVTGGNGEVKKKANGNGTTVTNAALAISQHTTKKPIEVTINGGTFNGTAAVYQTDVQGTGSADVKIAVKGGTFNGTISGETDGTIAISGGKFKVKVDDKYFADKLACSATPNADGYYTVKDHPIISAGISIGEDMSFRIMVEEGYENGSLKYYYIGVNGRVEGEGTIGTDTQGNSIFRIYNVNPQRADLIYVIQYYDADGNAIGAPKEISVLTYFEGFYNMEAGKNEDVEARKTFIANFLEYCASAMERSYADFPKETLDGKTWQYRADAVRAMMTRLGLKVADYEFKGNLGRYYNDNAKGNITDRGIVFGSTFRAYYEISKDIIDSGCRVFRQGTDVTDKLVLENGAYRFYFELAPYEFKDSLTITIYNGTTKVCEYSSPLANTLKAISESTNVSASKLAKAAFNYFVALQNYEG